jgi:hypothetical protein
MSRVSARLILRSIFALSALGSAELVLGQASRLDMPKDCLCLPPQRPACELAGRPEVVAIFLGRVSAIKRLPLGNFDTVQFQVEEVFRGSVDPSSAVQVHTHDCSPFVIADPFDEGKEYVVYATRNPSSNALQLGSDAVVNAYDESGTDFPFSFTSKAVEIRYAAEDLAYWRGYSHAPQTGRIFGTVKQHVRQLMFDEPSEERSFEMKPLVGQEVVVRNFEHSYTTKTDDLGRYEFQSIPPGEYEVSPSQAEETLFPAKVTADVSAKGCAQVDFRKPDLDSLRKKLDSVHKRKRSNQ